MAGSVFAETEGLVSRLGWRLFVWMCVTGGLVLAMIGVGLGTGQLGTASAVAALVLMLTGFGSGICLWLWDVASHRRRQRQMALFRHLARDVAVPLAMSDMKGRLLSANEAWCELFALPSGADREQTWHMGRIDSDDPDRQEQLLRDTLQGGTTRQVAVRRADGKTRRMVLVTSVVRERQMAAALAWALEDISEVADVADDVRRLATIAAHTADALIATDLDDTITSWNDGATRIFGYTRQEAIGQSIDMLIPEDLRGSYSEAMKAKMQQRGLIENIETVRLHRDGSKLSVHLSVSSIEAEDGRIIGRGLILRDITKQREFEQQLQRSAQQLEDDIKHAQRRMEDVARRHRDVLQRAGGCVLVAGGDAKVAQTSQAFYDVLGYSPKEVDVMRIMDFHDRGNARAVNDLVGEARHKGTARGAVEVQTRHGQNIPAEIIIHFYPELDEYLVCYELSAT